MRWLPVASLVLLAGGVSGAQHSGGTIEGQVVDAATGAPVRKAVVGLWHEVPPSKNDYSQIEADALGRFVLSDLTPGTYRVNAYANGFIDRDGDPFELDDGQKMSGITIRLTRSSAISGTVVDEDGDPLVGFGIQLYRATYASGSEALSTLFE